MSAQTTPRGDFADFLILTVALCGICIGIGEWLGRHERLQFYCEPGYVKAARYPDGRLDCWYRVTDWRGVTVKKPAKRIEQ